MIISKHLMALYNKPSCHIATWAQEYFRKLLSLNSLLLQQEMQLETLLL